MALNRRFGGIPAPGTEGGKVPAAGGTVGYRPELRGWVQKLKVDPLDPFQVSETLREARSEIHQQAETLPSGKYLLDTAAELGVRTSRIVQGIDRVTDDDAWNQRKRKDGFHYLVYGSTGFLPLEDKIGPRELVDTVHDEGGFVAVAHPYSSPDKVIPSYIYVLSLGWGGGQKL